MSLSPMFSIMKDFRVVVSEVGSEFVGSKLRDMYRDLGATFLLSTIENFLLLGKDESFPFFVEDRDADNAVEVGVGFDTLGVERCDALVTGDTGFFFTLVTFLSLLTGGTCTGKTKKNMSHQIQPNKVSEHKFKFDNKDQSVKEINHSTFLDSFGWSNFAFSSLTFGAFPIALSQLCKISFVS